MNTPSKEDIEKIEAMKKKKAAEVERVKAAINSAKEDVNVQLILSYLFDLAGFRANPVVLNQSMEITNATNYNLGRLSIFHDFRKLMSAETENLIERRYEENEKV